MIASFGVTQAATPITMHVPIEHIYSPEGFNDHESAEVVIAGLLPNLCHKSPKTEVRVEGSTIYVDLKSLYYHPSNPFCAPVLVPFLETVRLGVLDKGDYEIVVNNGTPFYAKSDLFIAERASDAIDDLVYANVSHVESKGFDRLIELRGYNPSDCFEIDSVQYRHNKRDTYTIEPVMKQVSDFCPRKMVPFTYEFVVPEVLDREKVLLHVRAMDGRSVSKIFNNEVSQ